MKWKIRKPYEKGAPMRHKDWLKLVQILQAFQDHIAYNHHYKMSCDLVDKDIKVLADAIGVAAAYFDRKE